jgi:DNA-directed RNA polymerase subunit RPC12/RpoP
VVHFIGYLFGHPLKDMWHASLVLGSLFYGSIIYWIWCLENEVYDVNADNMGCPHCHKKLQTRRIPEKTDRLPYQSPDTVTTKRYNADGDYIGHEETETGTSTTKYLIQETYKCEKCGHKWIVSF